MLSEVLRRIADTLRPEIEADEPDRRGLLKLATDRDEALVVAIRDLSVKWKCLLWIASVTGADADAGRKGVATAEIRVAVATRPRLTRGRADASLDRDDDLSLLNLWAFIRGLMVRLRFGLLQYDTPQSGRATFRARDGYLDGVKPPRMGNATFGREFYEVRAAAADAADKGDVKEMLWAETSWFFTLALPMYPIGEADENKWWLCTG